MKLIKEIKVYIWFLLFKEVTLSPKETRLIEEIELLNKEMRLKTRRRKCDVIFLYNVPALIFNKLPLRTKKKYNYVISIPELNSRMNIVGIFAGSNFDFLVTKEEEANNLLAILTREPIPDIRIEKMIKI